MGHVACPGHIVVKVPVSVKFADTTHTTTRSYGIGLAACVAAFVLIACSSNSTTGPHATPGISFLSGNRQSDTIDAVLSQALVVQVATASGQPAAHQVIQFDSVPVDSVGLIHPYAYVERFGTSSPMPFVSETTDASGKASIRIAMGHLPGTAPIPVKVPALGYADTAKFTVQAGHGLSWHPPLDGNVYVGHADTLPVGLRDRYGNASTDSVHYAVSGPGTISGSVIFATGLGVIHVTATIHDSIADTVTVGVVPQGTLAGFVTSAHTDYIRAFRLDGSLQSSIFGGFYPGSTVHWAPNGGSLVFDQAEDVWPVKIASVSTTGQISVLVDASQTSPGQLATVASPNYSRDGSVIYYANYTVPNGLWRVRPDGSGDSAVTMQVPEPVSSPSPSPDGSQVAYIAAGYLSVGSVKVLNVSTGVTTSLGVQAGSIAWSPNSDVIAYLTTGGALALLHASGTGNTVLSAGPFLGSPDWSPDGQWLVINDGVGGQLDIVNASSGAVIPEFYIDPGTYFGSPFVNYVSSPTWVTNAPALQRVGSARRR